MVFIMKQTPHPEDQLLQQVEELATNRGLIFIGVSGLDVNQDFKWFSSWLSEGRHAGMAFLERHLKLRANPAELLEGRASHAMIFALPYQQEDRWKRTGFAVPKIAMYARLKDYHRVLKQELEELMLELQQLGYQLTFRVTVDSAPLLERALASKSGQGFIGKNTCYIHPKHGSFLLLGEALIAWQPSEAFQQKIANTKPRSSQERTSDGGCGTCKRCQVHCPTGALDQDYRIDARKCLSWWTIENRGPIPEEYWPWVGQYLFGCDICQLVCPWNRGKKTQLKTQSLLKLKEDIDPYAIATMNQSTYESIFGGTPVTRAKREGLIRNALIALHTNKDERLLSALAVHDTEDHPAIAQTILAIRKDLAKTQAQT